MNAEGEMLREACGQDFNEDGQTQQCNYGELGVGGGDGSSSRGGSIGDGEGFGFGDDAGDVDDDAPPPISRASKPNF